MRTVIVGAFLLCTTALTGRDLSSDEQSKPPARNLEVVIVAVEDFQDNDYQNDLLNENIGETTDDVIKFFKAHFPNAQFVIRRDKDEKTQQMNDENTTSPKLKEFFSSEFPRIVASNITALFVLSHGEALPYADGTSDSDLRIITSDTEKKKFPAKTLSLSNDIVANLRGLPRGSFVFGYIDTCHGGAAHSVALATDVAIESARGMKLSMWAASLADAYDFQVNFTKALVRFWQKPPPLGNQCTDPNVVPSVIRDEINEMLVAAKSSPLKPQEGIPEPLVDSTTYMCIETFNADNAILDVMNGNQEPVQVYVRADSPGFPRVYAVKQTSAAFIWVPRGLYALEVFRHGSSLGPEVHFDLRKQEIQFYDVPGQLLAARAMNLEKAANAIDSLGGDPSHVDPIRQQALEAFEATQDLVEADRIAQFMGAPQPPSGLEVRISDVREQAVARQGRTFPAGIPVPNKEPKRRAVTATFDYDFGRTRACSPSIKRRCVKQFNVYDVSWYSRIKLFSIDAPVGEVKFRKSLSGTSGPLELKSRKTYKFAVTAVAANGEESDLSKPAKWERIARWIAISEHSLAQ